MKLLKEAFKLNVDTIFLTTNLCVCRTVTSTNSETNLFCLSLSDTHPEIKI